MSHMVRSKLLVGILLPLVVIYAIIAFCKTRRQARIAIAETKRLL